MSNNNLETAKPRYIGFAHAHTDRYTSIIESEFRKGYPVFEKRRFWPRFGSKQLSLGNDWSRIIHLSIPQQRASAKSVAKNRRDQMETASIKY